LIVFPHGTSGLPPQRMSAVVRSGKVAPKNTDSPAPSETPSSAARFDPTASSTARTSSTRWSSDGTT
jgi:hypothetical protein